MCVQSAMSDAARFDGARVLRRSAARPPGLVPLGSVKEAGGLLSVATDARRPLLQHLKETQPGY